MQESKRTSVSESHVQYEEENRISKKARIRVIRAVPLHPDSMDAVLEPLFSEEREMEEGYQPSCYKEPRRFVRDVGVQARYPGAMKKRTMFFDSGDTTEMPGGYDPVVDAERSVRDVQIQTDMTHFFMTLYA